MSFPGRRYRPSYSPPGRDSARAKAQAQLFLVGARSIDHLTIETFAQQWRLKTATAAAMLAEEVKRRAGR